MTWLPVLLGAISGALVGSFLATLVVRWPRGEQVVAGRSRCDQCGVTLRARAMVPVFSYLAAKGRCVVCAGRIDPLHLAVEIACAMLAGLAIAIQPGPAGAALALFWLMLVAPAMLDARHMWLPDRLTGLLALVGLVLGGIAFGSALADRLMGGATGFASLWLVGLVYRRTSGREGLGSGDPKLLGAIGLWTGWSVLPAIMLLAALAGIGAALASGRGRLDRMPLGTLMSAAAIVWSGLSFLAPRFGAV